MYSTAISTQGLDSGELFLILRNNYLDLKIGTITCCWKPQRRVRSAHGLSSEQLKERMEHQAEWLLLHLKVPIPMILSSSREPK